MSRQSKTSGSICCPPGLEVFKPSHLIRAFVVVVYRCGGQPARVLGHPAGPGPSGDYSVHLPGVVQGLQPRHHGLTSSRSSLPRRPRPSGGAGDGSVPSPPARVDEASLQQAMDRNKEYLGGLTVSSRGRRKICLGNL
ncbi:hypothetical protein MTO96_002219 [Rhipicephalus appendiculatus]